jgi:hypothetical protein
VAVVEFRDDGTLREFPLKQGPADGTWSAEGDSGVITVDGEEFTFSIDGDRLVFPELKDFVCAPAG